MSLKKTAKKEEPHAVFARGGWVWRVLKTYQTPRAEVVNQYARWMCAVSSPHTFGGVDMGDTYKHDIIQVAGAKLVAATTEWLQTYWTGDAVNMRARLPTPVEWLASHDSLGNEVTK